MKNILITGGAGYIGSHVTEVLIKNKKKIFIVDNLITGFKKLVNNKTKFYKADILDTKKMNQIIINNNIDSIIHLAGSLVIRIGEKNPSMDSARKSTYERSSERSVSIFLIKR